MLLPSIFKNNFVDDFFNGFDDMFSFPSITRVPTSRWMTTNVKDLGNEYLLEVELPGYDKKDITASLDKGYLTISANKEETKDEDSHKDGKYIRRERYSGSCKRSFYVGDNLKEKDFKASFENGILKIEFPKDNEVAKLDDKKYITIK
ncbi:MAG: Hsp20/alpha crystallin family protein [Anaerolineaceae bacterium]|nr:MAG: Hsp20/alpha crystallin family protein [Anaerolineaceae bacterium]